MSSSQAPYRGAVQAQGDDITKNGGYTRSWAENKPVPEIRGKKSALSWNIDAQIVGNTDGDSQH